MSKWGSETRGCAISLLLLSLISDNAYVYLYLYYICCTDIIYLRVGLHDLCPAQIPVLLSYTFYYWSVLYGYHLHIRDLLYYNLTGLGHCVYILHSYVSSTLVYRVSACTLVLYVLDDGYGFYRSEYALTRLLCSQQSNDADIHSQYIAISALLVSGYVLRPCSCLLPLTIYPISQVRSLILCFSNGI